VDCSCSDRSPSRINLPLLLIHTGRLPAWGITLIAVPFAACLSILVHAHVANIELGHVVHNSRYPAAAPDKLLAAILYAAVVLFLLIRPQLLLITAFALPSVGLTLLGTYRYISQARQQ
jgi:hypothetical protein